MRGNLCCLLRTAVTGARLKSCCACGTFPCKSYAPGPGCFLRAPAFLPAKRAVWEVIPP